MEALALTILQQLTKNKTCLQLHVQVHKQSTQLRCYNYTCASQQKLWQFPNIFRFAHSMCTNQYAKLDKLLVCKFANCLFVTTTVSICVNCLHTYHLQNFLPRNPTCGSFQSLDTPRIKINIQSLMNCWCTNLPTTCSQPQ